MPASPTSCWQSRHPRYVSPTKEWNAFRQGKIILTGNPVRQGLLQHNMSREDAVRSFQLDPAKKTVLIIGGSLGARTINNCVMQGLDKIRQSGVQFIWQTGKYTSAKRVRRCPVPANCRCCTPPTSLQTWQQPTVPPTWSSVGQEPAPSPNFACWANRSSWYHRPTWQKTIRPKCTGTGEQRSRPVCKDAEAGVKLLDTAIATVQQPDTLNKLSTNIAKLAFKDSANVIAGEVWKLAATYRKEHGR